jgi:hypothetical protein
VEASLSTPPLRALGRVAAYAWTAPNTLLGLAGGLAMLLLGGRVQPVQGTLEFHGGLPGRIASRAPPRLRFSAITLGHVILGVDAAELSAARAHEQVHVRQYERWGPAFLPAYAFSSAWQVLRGRHLYRDNAFEIEARALERRPDDATGRD